MQNGKIVRETAGYEFDEIADNEGFIVVYPNAYKGSWNDARKVGDYPARNENINEAEFVRKMIQYFQAKYGINTKKVFGVGFSNGGQLVHRLASELPYEFNGLAAIMATRPTMDNFIGVETGGEVPMLLIAGTGDNVVPYHGGVIQLFFMKPRGTAMSAYESAEFYAKRNGIYSAPIAKFLPHQTQSGDTAVVQFSYKGEGKKPVELYTAIGVGHVIPNKNKRFPRLMGKSTADLDAPKEIWKFFKQFI
jgi:polyhydroxybutyrate depolymerase